MSKLEMKLPPHDEERKIIPAGIEYSESQKAILDKHRIKRITHPINVEHFCELLKVHGDSLEAVNEGKSVFRYEKIVGELDKLSSEELANLINNYDIDNPKMDLLWIKAAYQILIAKKYIQFY